jgi:hypothetical protein
MSIETLLTATAVAGALLGFWAVVRFPLLGPRTLPGAAVNVGAALAVNAFAPPLVAAIAHDAPAGAYVALFGVVLPALSYAFWAGGCLVRIAQQALSGLR